MNRIALVWIVLIGAVITAAGCAPTRTTSDDEFRRLATQVESEIRLAEKAGFLWRDTERLLQDARAAQQAGRAEDATRLANAALKQAQLAQQQARDNANAGPIFPSSNR